MSGLPTEPRSEDELNRRDSKLCRHPTRVRMRAVHSFMQFAVEACVLLLGPGFPAGGGRCCTRVVSGENILTSERKGSWSGCNVGAEGKPDGDR